MSSRARRTTEEIRVIERRLEERGLLRPLASLCREYNVTLRDVLSGSREKRIVHARDACVYRILRVPMSQPEVGHILDMDHSTVCAARQRYEKRDMGRLLT